MPVINLCYSNREYSGFGLVFGTWPVALGTLPGGIHWIRGGPHRFCQICLISMRLRSSFRFGQFSL
jgi:hypothetical protein